MKMLSRFAAVSTLALGVLAGPSFASAQTAVNITTTDTALLAKGVAVQVTVEVTCTFPSPPATNNFLFVELTQRSGSKLARGSAFIGGSNFSCGSEPQTQVLFLTIQTDGTAALRFKKGEAFAHAFIDSCNEDFSFCDHGEDGQVIKLSQ